MITFSNIPTNDDRSSMTDLLSRQFLSMNTGTCHFVLLLTATVCNNLHVSSCDVDSFGWFQATARKSHVYNTTYLACTSDTVCSLACYEFMPYYLPYILKYKSLSRISRPPPPP